VSCKSPRPSPECAATRDERHEAREGLDRRDHPGPLFVKRGALESRSTPAPELPRARESAVAPPTQNSNAARATLGRVRRAPALEIARQPWPFACSQVHLSLRRLRSFTDAHARRRGRRLLRRCGDGPTGGVSGASTAEPSEGGASGTARAARAAPQGGTGTGASATGGSPTLPAVRIWGGAMTGGSNRARANDRRFGRSEVRRPRQRRLGWPADGWHELLRQ
jgi:hypothetical protein